jgi:S-DNA-T family DNA segregation ATPase FtsK/SpoIIIE
VQIVFDDERSQRELDLQIDDPGACVADLMAALDPRSGHSAAGLVIDGWFASRDLELVEAGLHDGAVVSLAAHEPTRHPDLRRGELGLEVVGGLEAGRRYLLAERTTSIGRGGGNDVALESDTVSRHHAVVEVQAGRVGISDLGSHNGTWVDGSPVAEPTELAPGQMVRVGAAGLVLRSGRDGDRPGAIDPRRHVNPAGTIAFNRPPPPAPPPGPAAVEAPRGPEAARSRVSLNVVSILAPLALGAVLVVVFDSIIFAAFALLSPVVALGNWSQSRRSAKRSTRKEAQRYQGELEEFRRLLTAAGEQQATRAEAAAPDLAEVVRRATLPSVRLWERRPGHADFLVLRAGSGDVAWSPPVEDHHRDRPPEVSEAVAAAGVLPGVAVTVQLARGGVVGIVGERAPALALARGLVFQAATHQGPADVAVVVLTTAEAAGEWDWTKWLPHTREPGGGPRRLLSADGPTSQSLLEALVAPGSGTSARRSAPGAVTDDDTVVLAVVDDETLTKGRRAPARALLRGAGPPVAGIVIASAVDRLPAMCDTVIEMQGHNGEATLTRPQLGERIPGFMACGLSDDTARQGARSLARFEDPELDIAGAGLPDRVRLLPLLGLDEPDVEAVSGRWGRAGPVPPLLAPIGVDEAGVFQLDLVKDGPHALVAGTTGSGKSELLRTLVAGLAATVDPDHLNFVLVDYKGGSAFDVCAHLPHVVGMVTDLDEHLGERALRSLEAELRHREKVLRDARAPDLAAYLRSGGPREPLPRLVVVIDEFATLAAELPDFVDALVGIAQRGRSLGVHLILATQRPSGAVNENIKANTNLRVALRVQDKVESTDVIGVPDAAGIGRGQAGRCYVRLGPGEVVPVQSALSTAVGGGGPATGVGVRPFCFGPGAVLTTAGTQAEGGPASDLARLVEAVSAAFSVSGRPAPRRPWLEPLAGDLDLVQIVSSGTGPGLVPFALVDDPEGQRQFPTGWRPEDGNLLMYGIVGSGTTTALASVALALASTHTADDAHLYVVDFGAGELAPLAGLPHTGAVIGAGEGERQLRLMRFLRTELDRRRQLPPAERDVQPLVVVLVDGCGGLVGDLNDVTSRTVGDDFDRVFAAGPEVGIAVVATAGRPGAIPMKLASQVRQRWAFRLADIHDYSAFGIPARSVPPLTPGRAILGGSTTLVQVARPREGLQAAVEGIAKVTDEPRRPAPPVGVLPVDVGLSEVAAGVSVGSRPWFLPIAVGESDLRPCGLVVHEGEHILVTGPARAGKSTALATIASVLRLADPAVVLVGVAGSRSPLSRWLPLDHHLAPEDIDEVPSVVAGIDRRCVVLVDDAESTANSVDAMVGLLQSPDSGALVVAAGRPEVLRGGFSHWTRTLRHSKLGVLLRPNPDLDGELLGTLLPRRAPVPMVAGRGYLVVDGEAQLVHLAQSTEVPPNADEP